MAAQEVHIAKYITQHRALFPTARVLLVQNLYDHNFGGSKARKHLEPGVVALKSTLPLMAASSEGNKPQMIVHTFSNGGVFSISRFLQIFREQSGSGLQDLPPFVTIMDSCPTYFDWSRMYRALTAPM